MGQCRCHQTYFYCCRPVQALADSVGAFTDASAGATTATTTADFECFFLLSIVVTSKRSNWGGRKAKNFDPNMSDFIKPAIVAW